MFPANAGTTDFWKFFMRRNTYKEGFAPTVNTGGSSAIVSPDIRTRFPQRAHPFIAWVALIGILFPPIEIPLGDLRLSPGRIIAICLLIPAISKLLRDGRPGLACDLFAFATAAWMIGASALNGGYRPSAVAEALEFLGGYMLGRAYFSGYPGLQTFVRIMKVIVIVLIALAALDTLSGRDFTQEIVAKFFTINEFIPQYRFGLVRATSTFTTAELFGTFCAISAAIFLFSETGMSRLIYVGLCTVGCGLSLSSGPLLAFAIVMSSFIYNRLLGKFQWRWKALIIAGFGLLTTIFVLSDNPFGFIVRHLTLDPWTGYWRIAEWDHGIAQIYQTPLLGRGFTPYTNPADVTFLGISTDSVWLLVTLRYGIPMTAFLILTIFASLRTPRGSGGRSAIDLYNQNMRTSVSILIVSMCIIGLTVHFWNTLWIFFSVCIGIRGALSESANVAKRRVRFASPQF